MLDEYISLHITINLMRHNLYKTVHMQYVAFLDSFSLKELNSNIMIDMKIFLQIQYINQSSTFLL